MKKCLNCNFENKDTACFCVKCGKKLGKRCPKCGNNLEEGELYCPVCGSRTDGKIFCPVCGAPNEQNAAYCEKCGKAIAAPETENAAPAALPPVSAGSAVANSASFPNLPAAANKNEPPKVTKKEKKNVRKIVDKILNITRASLILAFSLIMFIMSFMSVTKIDAPEDTAEELSLDLSGIISVNVSSIDMIEGAFSRIDPKSETEMIKDLGTYLMNHLSKKDLELLDKISDSENITSSDAIEALNLITGLLEDYNILKLLSTKETVELTPSNTMEFWICAAMSVLHIGLSAAFLIVAVIDFIQTLQNKKKNRKVLFTLCAFTLASAIGYAFIAKLVFDGSIGYGLVTFLVFSVLSLLVEAGYRIFAGECRFEKAKIPLYISAGAGAVLAFVMLFLSCSSLTKIVCEYLPADGTARTFRSGYNASMLAEAWNAIKYAAEDQSIVGKAGEFIPSLFSLSGSSSLYDEIMKSFLAPSMMGILGQYEIETGLAVLGVLTELLCLALVVTLSLSVSEQIRAVKENRKSKLVYGILNLSLAAVLMTLAIVYSVLVNRTMENVEKITYTVRISGAIIAVVSLGVIDLAQKITCRIVTKKLLSKAEHKQNAFPENTI